MLHGALPCSDKKDILPPMNKMGNGCGFQMNGMPIYLFVLACVFTNMCNLNLLAILLLKKPSQDIKRTISAICCEAVLSFSISLTGYIYIC